MFEKNSLFRVVDGQSGGQGEAVLYLLCSARCAVPEPLQSCGTDGLCTGMMPLNTSVELMESSVNLQHLNFDLIVNNMQYSASRSSRRDNKVVNDWVLLCCAVVRVQGESRTLQPLGYNDCWRFSCLTCGKFSRLCSCLKCNHTNIVVLQEK